jgi:hypothetical protein
MEDNRVDITLKQRHAWLLPLVETNLLIGASLPIIIKSQRLAQNNTNALVSIKDSFLNEFKTIKIQLKALKISPSVQTHTLKLLQHWIAHRLPILNTTSDAITNEKQLYLLLQSSAEKETLHLTLKLSYLLAHLNSPSKSQASHYQAIKTLLNHSTTFQPIAYPKKPNNSLLSRRIYSVKVILISLLCVGASLALLSKNPLTLSLTL